MPPTFSNNIKVSYYEYFAFKCLILRGHSNSQSIEADYKAKLMNDKSFYRLLVMPLY